MTDEEFAQLVEHGHETRGVEFKPPGARSNGHLLAQVVKAMLGMANRRGGGRVILGVRELPDKTLRAEGLSGEVIGSWHLDHLGPSVAPYGEPTIEFDVEVRNYKQARFVVIQVQEFPDIPVLCNNTFQSAASPTEGRAQAETILKKGACYVRSLRKPETSEIATQEDMRALIDLAVEKGVRRYAELAKIAEAAKGPSTEERYDAELRDLQ